MKRVFSIFIFVLLVFGCQFKGRDDNTKSFVIVDQDSNKILNKYEYSTDNNQLLRTESYNSNELLSRSIDFSYDDRGNLAQTVEDSFGMPVKTTEYETEDVLDNSGRLIKTIRTSSTGQVIETYYGYDENGTLRGVVEQTDTNTVMMKDYEN